jgi:ring-1,2-phenylacetyl-CoA epoxidase subunit PaaD
LNDNAKIAHELSHDLQRSTAVSRIITWDGSRESVLQLLQRIPDPEIPVVSLVDLGIVRAVSIDARRVTVTVTPTYAGCPATEVIKQDILRTLHAAGVVEVEVHTQLSPPWTTDWLSEAGKRALRDYGIAPPCTVAHANLRTLSFRPACPRCASHHTELLSAFGATPCKALHRCRACGEPFDYFKPL